MHNHVTYHACLRYLERVLGLPVGVWLIGMEHLPENLRAQHCCERAGLPVDAVKAAIMQPAILRICLAGFDEVAVRLDGFVYIIKHGVVATVLTPRIYMGTMGSRYGAPRIDRSKKRRREKKRLAAAEVDA